MSVTVRPRAAHEPLIIPNGDPVIVFESRIGAIVHFPVLEDQGHGYVAKTFEKYVRSPGSRLIAIRDNNIYLQKEARLESIEKFDWRLPGGKVIDTFAEYKHYLGKLVPTEIILKAALKELQEEAHLTGEPELFTRKVCGTTVEWDLYYVVVKNVVPFQPDHAHAEGEEVAESGWFTFDEVRNMCEKGIIGEARSAAVLIEFVAR